jgi:endo-1,4-beta-xylanase
MAFVVFGSGCSTPVVRSVDDPGTGGATASGEGGVPGSGGAPGAGGIWESSGGSGSGGRPGSGGEPSAGGAAASGGVSGNGGGAGTGGATALGGASGGSGGDTGTGGTPSTGGRTSTRTRVGTGGSTGTGGATNSGGGPSTGGATGTGGSGAGGTTGLPVLRKFVGNIDTRGQIRSDFATYWDQFSPENAGKWSSVQGNSQSTFNWSTLDAMYKYCNDNNIIFKEHTFVWGAQQPNWTANLTTSDGPAAVQNWMKSFCARYPKVAIIDVVNEPPPHTTPKYANAIGGGTNSTWDWIANAFKWAREACPNAILVLNDYNNAELRGDAQHSIDIVTAIRKLGAPIDAVGCQTHGASNTAATNLKTNIDNIASGTGLPIYITEYDINLADDNQQKTRYQDHFTMFMSNNNIKGITVWGYIVGATWLTNTGIMQSSGTMRPAMTWLMDFLGR